MAEASAKTVGIRTTKDPATLASKRQQLAADLNKDRQEWRLNREFYKGNQWVFPNPITGQIESLGMFGTDEMSPRFKVRLTSNQILPSTQAYVAQLTKTKPVITATPDSGDDKDLKAAQMAESLFEYWWREFGLKSKLQSALTNATLSQGYWKISWDPYAGRGTTFMIDPTTKQPITDPMLADLFKENLQEQGLDPQQFSQTVNLGDIRVEVVPGENVIIDPAAATFEDATFAICQHALDPAEIKARWGVDVQPDAVSSEEQVGLPFGIQTKQSKDRRNANTRNVYVAYFRKGPTLPQGRYVVWVEGPDTILADEAWPFPFDELPLVHFPGLERPNSPLDEPITTHARPIQKEINRTISQVVQHKNLTIKPQMLAPANSLRQRLTEEPGAVFEYNPVLGEKPEWREMPALPPYVFEHLGEMQQRLDRLYNLQAVSQGNVPPNVEAGIAIDMLQEAAADQVSPVIQRLEESLVKAGHIMASFAQKYYIEPRLLKIIGSGGSVQVRKFKNSDISGGFSFHAESGSGLPRTRAGRQARIEFLLEKGLIDPKQAIKMLDVADMKGALTKLEADEDQALREHEKLMKGQILNPVAFAEAQQQVQQVMQDPTADPDGDGVPDTPEQKMAWAQQTLEQAAIAPFVFEDYQTHLDTHALFMKSVEFEGLPEPVQDSFIDHYSATLQTMMSLPQRPDPQAVRTTLQLKGTVGPTAASQILNKGGVFEVTPEEMAEPPLETWVTDDTAEPNVDSEGNHPLSQAEQLQNMQQSAQQHDLNAAKTAHEAVLAHRKSAREDELHQEKLKQMRKPAPSASGR